MDHVDHDSDDDIPHLSIDTFAALQEFYRDQDERESIVNQTLFGIPDNIVNIQEDWQLSQFWYDEDTIKNLVNIAVQSVGIDGKIALISCPSLYKSIKNKLGENGEVHLYEFDTRFAVYGQDYNFFDYKTPLGVPKDKAGFYDLLIADPPFLSEECLTKVSVTMKYLTKHKIILCTGAVMAQLADRLLNLKKINFEPKHKNNLGNEFWCYTNFEVNS